MAQPSTDSECTFQATTDRLKITSRVDASTNWQVYDFGSCDPNTSTCSATPFSRSGPGTFCALGVAVGDWIEVDLNSSPVAKGQLRVSSVKSC